MKHTAGWAKLTSDEHFSVDGTLIEAWASHKRFQRKDDDSSTPPGRNPEVDFKGQARCNDTPQSTTDADARLFKKSAGDKSRLCHRGHILMENRNGLIVDVEITHASGTAEREAALAMLERRDNKNQRATVGADKGYDSKAFIQGCRQLEVTPHVAAKDKHSAVDGRIQRHAGYRTSQKVRTHIEEAFGWIKTVSGSGQDQTDRPGQAHGPGAAVLCYLQPGAQGLNRRLAGRTSCVSRGIGAPEMGEMACKQAGKATAIAAQTRSGDPLLRNQ